jgi:7-cyano-7-deazaguanine synthase
MQPSHVLTPAVVLLSGGLDSTTVATHAVREGWSVRALCIHYGQRHARELDSARAVARHLEIPLHIVDAGAYRDLAAYSALTSPDAWALPTDRPPAAMSHGVPITYVPMRNTFFVTLAAAALESWCLALIEQEGVDPARLRPAIAVGANAIDYSGYPDCRPEFYRALEAVLLAGSKLGSAYGVAMRIEAPIIELSKEQIVRRAVELGAPLALTWSCYAGGQEPCGTCDSCQLRAQGFAAAGVADPALGNQKGAAAGDAAP